MNTDLITNLCNHSHEVHTTVDDWGQLHQEASLKQTTLHEQSISTRLTQLVLFTHGTFCIGIEFSQRINTTKRWEFALIESFVVTIQERKNNSFFAIIFLLQSFFHDLEELVARVLRFISDNHVTRTDRINDFECWELLSEVTDVIFVLINFSIVLQCIWNNIQSIVNAILGSEFLPF